MRWLLPRVVSDVQRMLIKLEPSLNGHLAIALHPEDIGQLKYEFGLDNMGSIDRTWNLRILGVPVLSDSKTERYSS